MLSHQVKEQLLSRIISGRTKIRSNNKLLYILPPTSHTKSVADELYEHTYNECLKNGLYNDVELYDFLLSHNHWSVEEDNRVTGLEKDIEEMKVKLYQLNFQSHERSFVKVCLRDAKEQHLSLLKKKTTFDYLGADSVANSARQKYMVGHSLYTISLKKFPFKWNKCDGFDEIMYQFYSTRIKNECFRELSRTEPWLSTLSAAKYCKPIFENVFTLTDEQRALLTWSTIYDNIRNHPECPPEDIISDDDVLDGWLIVQKRKHNEQNNRAHADSMISDKVRGSEEIFLIADTIEDISKIDGLNDPASRMLKRQKIKKVQAAGDLCDDQMPDSQNKIRMLANQQFKNQVYKR